MSSSATARRPSTPTDGGSTPRRRHRRPRRTLRGGTSRNLAYHGPHLVRREGAQRRLAKVALPAQRKQRASERLVVRCFGDEHEIVGAERPVDVRDADAHLLKRRPRRLVAVDALIEA